MALRHPIHGIRQRGRRSVVVGTLLAGTLVASSVAAASVAGAGTVPKPLEQQVVGAASYGGGAVANPRVDLFYTRGTNGTLVGKVDGQTLNLGGTLVSGVAAMATASGEFVDESVYGQGTDGAIWHRDFSDGQGQWLPWQSLGGLAIGAPGVTCVGNPPRPVVFVTGLDFRLWRRTTQGWGSQGGDLWSDPVGLNPAGGVCPDREEAYALGGDFSVWEWQSNSGWHRIGGQSYWSPAATLLPDGSADLYVVGTDDAMWVAHREPGIGDYGPFHRIGGVFTSSPVAVADVGATPSRNVLGLGTDGSIWRLSDVIGGAEQWTSTQVQ